MIDATKRAMPPDIRAEFERLETLPEGKPTPEQEVWIEEVLRTCKPPSKETVQLCLEELRSACTSAQFELNLQPEAKPGRQKRRYPASQVKRSIDDRLFNDSLVVALASAARLHSERETMPPDARAEFDRITQLSQEDVTPEDDAWLKDARDIYAPSREVFQRQLARLTRMCQVEKREVGSTAGMLPASEAQPTAVTASEPET